MRAFECSDDRLLAKTEGTALVNKVQQEYAKVQALQGRFRQESFLAALETGEASSGEMWFSKPGKMRWNYNEPQPQTVIIRDGTLWLYQREKRQVLIERVGDVLLTDLPVAFLMGLGNLSKDFELQKACRNADGVVLNMVPRSTKDQARDALEGFSLLVSESGGLPKGARVASVGGNITAIVFEGLQQDKTPPAAQTFVLDYPKGVDIMDHRPSSGSQG